MPARVFPAAAKPWICLHFALPVVLRSQVSLFLTAFDGSLLAPGKNASVAAGFLPSGLLSK